MTLDNRSASSAEEFAVVLASALNNDYSEAVVVTGPASIMLRPEATLAQYQDLTGRLYKESQRLDCVELMIKFMVGDLLAQGEGVFGEDYACVFGVQLNWALVTINNIIRTARNIPPDLRRLNLSYRFYQDIAGADLPRDILNNYISLADTYKREGNPKWRKEVLDLISEYKVDGLMADMHSEEREKWYTLWTDQGRPNWRVVEGWVDGTKEIPFDPTPVGKFVVRLLDERLPEAGFSGLTYGQVRQAVADAMIDLANAVARRICAAGGGSDE